MAPQAQVFMNAVEGDTFVGAPAGALTSAVGASAFAAGTWRLTDTWMSSEAPILAWQAQRFRHQPVSTGGPRLGRQDRVRAALDSQLAGDLVPGELIPMARNVNTHCRHGDRRPEVQSALPPGRRLRRPQFALQRYWRARDAVGQDGDFFRRFDGTDAGHTILCHKEAGARVATAA